MGTTLVVNPGSSSKKYALYVGGNSVLDMAFENTNAGFVLCTKTPSAQQLCEAIKEKDFSAAFARVVGTVTEYLSGKSAVSVLDSIVIRVVAPGTYFQQHAEVTEQYIAELKKREAAAPLHIPVIVKEIRNAQHHFPGVKVIAASDSAFHREMPAQARDFSIPTADSEQYDIHRFGFHGLSVASIVRRMHAVIGIDPERMIICHVGSGTSVTAIKNGKGVETTMGFSPSTGLAMGSRAGDLDTAALLELMRIKNLKPADIEMYTNTQGGLYGMAGDADIRRLLDRRSQNDAAATQALDTFTYQIQKAVAALTVPLGGLDVLVLTATAAVRSTELRCLILRGLTHLGVQVSQDRNNVLIGKDGVISVANSQVKVVVMRTDEMGEMVLVADQQDLLVK